MADLAAGFGGCDVGALVVFAVGRATLLPVEPVSVLERGVDVTPKLDVVFPLLTRDRGSLVLSTTTFGIDAFLAVVAADFWAADVLPVFVAAAGFFDAAAGLGGLLEGGFGAAGVAVFAGADGFTEEAYRRG